MRRITATEAARDFSNLLSRVHHAGETFVVVRNGRAVCQIGPAQPAPSATIADLVELLQQLGPVDEGFAKDVAKAQKRQPKLPSSPWTS
jgi:antitoxin (DNA-binding transcriptional repressor) of toxin-antitoxin stability system